MQLHQVSIGKKAKILEFQQRGVFLKLLEMGLLPNITIEVLGKAPLGDPIYISVQETLIALRKSEAQNIVVQIIE
ncbi:FeoA family protein [Raineya orbicola]|jgi:ferrous iron transport protein A|uniref:Fe2+ transport system protein A n=1 Tax=Raineya orbicola TaxID=2016530 RepID=A0A2N3IIU5_9BACT|nr:FeoA family protein [Raineya orbicola]PKQ70216.1 Fe2+ transport system protein A [Raineya orbicola]